MCAVETESVKFRRDRRPFLKILAASVLATLCLALVSSPSVLSDPVDLDELTLQEAYALALESNHDIRSAAESVEQGRLLQKQAVTVLYPRISATAGYRALTFQDDTDLDWGSAGLNLSQTIYNGGKVWVAKRGAESTLRSAELGLDFARQSVLMDLVMRSNQLLSSEDLLKVSEKRVERVLEQLRQAEARLEVGEVPRTSVLAAQVALSSVQLEEVEAKKAVALARTRLSNLIGSSQNVRVLMPPSILLPYALALDDLVQAALDRRPDLDQGRELVKIALEEAELVRREGYPSVMVSGAVNRYSKNDLSLEESRIGIDLTWPFFQGGLVSLRKKEADSKVRQAEEAYGNQVDSIRLEVEEALLNLEALQTQEEMVVNSLNTAMENHRLARTRFELGAATSLEVLDSEEDLAVAEYLQVTHKYDTRTARAALLYSVGALELENFGIAERTGKVNP